MQSLPNKAKMKGNGFIPFYILHYNLFYFYLTQNQKLLSSLDHTIYVDLKMQMHFICISLRFPDTCNNAKLNLWGLTKVHMVLFPLFIFLCHLRGFVQDITRGSESE